MKRMPIVFALLALVFGGCATLDRRDIAVLQQHHVSQAVYNKMLATEPLSLADVIELSRRAVPSSLIVHYLRSTDAEYHLKSKDVTHLVEAGVSQRVVDYLLAAGSYYAPYGYYAPPAYYPYSPYYNPGPFYYGYPAPAIYLGGSYRFHGRDRDR